MISERARVRLGCIVAIVGAVGLAPRPAGAWAIGSQINETGCHEPITAEALRTVRMHLATAPEITPTRDEAALIDDVLFAAPPDFVHDLAAMSLMLGVRDNDLKGVDPLSSLDLIQVHGNPLTQQEHCIRRGSDDGATGDQGALDACRTFIRETATAALDGLAADGTVDPTQRIPFDVYVALAGQVRVPLPLFYIKIGAAMHALEDGFTHAYRTEDGMQVTVVTNWIDLVSNGSAYDEARDGPEHSAPLDHCWHGDPLIQRNYQLATRAATELLAAALDPTLTRDQKIAKFDEVTATYLTYHPGCTFDNHYCNAPEALVADSNPAGCDAGGGSGAVPWAALGLLGVIAYARRRRRSTAASASAALLLLGLHAGTARADADADRSPAPPPPAIAHADLPPAPSPTPVEASAQPTEPGRDVKTPTTAEIQAVRKDKELGSAWGVTGAIGGSVDRTAAAGSVGLRYRLRETWLIGLDGGWNPWITTSPVKERAGVGMLYATLIRRYPMRYDRVNLRTSLHLGASMLLFDVYGAQKNSIGPYVAFAPLGIDYDLGQSVRLVVDPVELAIPIPQLGQLPLYYEQFRFMIGIQIGG